MTGPAFDPTHPDVKRDPYPFYAELRRAAPVHFIEKTGFYAVARQREVREVLRDPVTFSSRAMRYTRSNGRASAASMMLASQNVPPERVAQLIASLPFPPQDLVGAKSVVFTDPPDHDALRAIVNRGFTPRRIAELEPRVREIARACLADVRGKGEMDLVTDLAIPVPVTVISELLGVDPERRDDFKRWSDAIVASSGDGDPSRSRTPPAIAFIELFQYLAQVIEERRRSPREDLISTLVRAEEGETLSAPEVAIFTLLLLVAGNETTTNLLGNTVLALTRNPAELARVQREPDLVPTLVEEGLRYDSPAQVLFREATTDTELAGVPIPAGSIVVPMLGSANRDSEVFPWGDRFELHRDRPAHLAFGLGVHFCLGAALARLEARVALEELLTLRGIRRRDSAELERIDSFMLRGLRSLPIVFEG